jgi:hypothetical protein
MGRVQAVGDRLREARMRQDIDLTEVEAVTKIRAKFLRAMEEDEWGVLPGPTYVRSFLRTYAEFLGLDPHLVVQEYRARYEADREDEPALTARRPSVGLERRGRRPGPGFVVGAVLVGVLAFFLILGLTGPEAPTPERPSAAVGTADRTDAERRPRERRRARRAAPRRVSLVITPVEPSYVCVDDGRGTRIFEGIVTGRRSFRRRRLRLNLGRPTAIVRVNGRRVRHASVTDPVGYDFRPGRRPRTLATGERPCA